MKSLFKSGMVLSLASSLIFSACSSEPQEKAATPQSVQVESMLIGSTELPSYYESVGTVRASQTAQLAAQTMGNVLRVNVREGDHVASGQVLATIDDSQARAGLERATAGKSSAAQAAIAAQAEFSLAESTLKRYELLRERKSVSAHEFEEVQARYEAAKAQRDMAAAGIAGADAALAQARTAQGFTRILAPFPGVVTGKFVEPGNLASPGSPLFSIEDTSAFRLEVTVDESNIGAVKLGTDTPVLIDAVGDAPITARVVQILPSADPASRSFLVKLQLPRLPAIRSGLFGRVRILSGVRQGYAVPKSAIVRRGSMEAVYSIGSDQIASLRYLTLGRESSGSYEVLSGLQAGDKIVTNPGNLELNGKRVEVRR